ncbi:MAG TPA: hypothetical protein VGW09_11560, partial [Nitrososphaeraceae archaeon]|nr:hypothetical protein [Nitrososphaeraceae archaeon]
MGEPISITLDSSGNVYVDRGNSRIQVFVPWSIFLRWFDVPLDTYDSVKLYFHTYRTWRVSTSLN